jgi:thiamine kinase-like enzyme
MALAYLDGLPDDALPLPRERIVKHLGRPIVDGDRLVHGDIIPENLIRGRSGLWLIDWEYGGIGIPEIDLASVMANADLDSDEAAAFLAAYGSSDMQRVEQQRTALIVREALWCLTQMRHAGEAGDLVAYTQTCIERMSKEFS